MHTDIQITFWNRFNVLQSPLKPLKSLKKDVLSLKSKLKNPNP